MRLSGRQIDCIRGGRERVLRPRFRGLVRRGAGRGRPERLRQDLAAAPDRGPPGAGRRICRPGRRRGRADAAGAIPLSRPSRCAETGAERGWKTCRSGGIFSAARPATSANAFPPWASAMPRICRRRISRPASGGGFRSPACSWCAGRSGSWTSRPRRSIPPGRTCSSGVMRDHLAGGGIIIAATHTPLGIEARELRMGGAT